MRTLAAVILALSVAVDLAAATRTWTGSAGINWTIASNWSGGSAPVAGDDLVFPASGANQVNNNDFPPGTPFNSLLFSGGRYNLIGNPFTLGAGGINATNNGFHTISAPVTLAAAQTWTLSKGSAGVSVIGGIDLNGMALTINATGGFSPGLGAIRGGGSISLNGPSGSLNLQGMNTSTAPLTVTNDQLFVHESYPAPIIIGDFGQLFIDPGQAVGTITAAGLDAALTPAALAGAGNSGDVKLIPNSQLNVFIQTPSSFDSLAVTGTVSLGGADLVLATGNALIPAGMKFTIIVNDGSDPVTGTFRGLPEGAQVVAPFQTPEIFSVSYIGGTGNDVVLTAVGPATGTNMSLTSSSNPSLASSAVTFTAKVTATSGTAVPTGSVDFLEFIAPNTLTKLATVALDSTGTATFTTSSLVAGTHAISAKYYNNNPPFAPVNNAVNQLVTNGPLRHRVVVH